MRAGMDRETGRLLTGWDHCAQSILDIVTTRVGSRLMRRAYGAGVRELQDRNPDPRTILEIFSAIARALRLHEPGFRLRKVVPVSYGPDGVGVFEIFGTFYPRGHLGDYSLAEERTMTLNPRGFRRIS